MKRDPKTPSKTFCVLPWMHRFTNIGGEIQICCTSEEKDNNISVDGRRMNAPKDFDNEKIINSVYMKNLRAAMLRGEWMEQCDRCRITESSGCDSRRTNENRSYADLIPKLLENTEDDGTLKEITVVSFDVRLGNTCNLACRMCSPRSSSKWARDWLKVDQDLFAKDPLMLESYKHYNWYKSPVVLEEFKKQLPHLRHVHFAGGEPLVVPEMLGFLRAAVESGYSKNIEVSYNTNITVLPPEVKILWPRFRAVKLLCSVDGYGPINEFIRYPSKWAAVDKNLRDIDAHFQEYGVTEVLLMCTAQVYNIFHLRELYDYLAENFKNITKLPHLIDLHYPNFYRSQILPPDLKAIAEKRLTELLEVSRQRVKQGVIPEYKAYLLDTLQSTINFMKMEDSSNWIPQFRRAAESKDGFRNQNVYTIIPELEPLSRVSIPPKRPHGRLRSPTDVQQG